MLLLENLSLLERQFEGMPFDVELRTGTLFQFEFIALLLPSVRERCFNSDARHDCKLLVQSLLLNL